eukprot:3657512-Rhodomonas_salina.1
MRSTEMTYGGPRKRRSERELKRVTKAGRQEAARGEGAGARSVPSTALCRCGEIKEENAKLACSVDQEGGGLPLISRRALCRLLAYGWR